MRVRAGVLAVACLLTAACTPTNPGTPTPSPTPSPTSRPETSVEREQRLAYEEAEAAYRTALSETGKILQKGGSATVPNTIKATATGPFLDDIEFFLTDYKKTGDRERGSSVITKVERRGYEPDELLLLSCVDGRAVTVYNKSGKVKTRGGLFVFDLVARRLSGQWKIYSSKLKENFTCPE